VDCAQVHTRDTLADVAPARLAVVVIRDRSWRHQPDPVLYLSGGPGGPAWIDEGSIEYWLDWVDDAQLERDLVLYDVRGVGMSEPRLSCPELLELYRAELAVDRPIEESLARQYEAALACKQTLLAAGHRLDNYSTNQNVRDLEDVMATLGYPAWNIYAVSYGTRLAIRAAQANAQGMRSLLLDSVYPPDKNSLALWPGLANDALQRLFAACTRHAECANNYPDLAQQFRLALARLDREPLHVSVEDWWSGEQLAVVVNEDRFYAAVFEALYSRDLIEFLPQAIAEAARGDGTTLQPIIESHVNFLLDRDFSDAVFVSVECADTVPITREDYLAEVERFPLIADLLRNAWDYDVCRTWHEAPAPETMTALGPIQTPALLLSGELDPVTPPSWAEAALPLFASAHHVSFAGIGHDVLGSEECALRLWTAFLEQPNVRPAHACLNDRAPVAFRTEPEPAGEPLELPAHRAYN
jgi:pimeloyl-ACP methyl ester carboxylesterase